MSAVQLKISELGAQGDGIAQGAGGQVFIPFTAPGDTVSAAVEGSRGTLISVLEPGEARATPPCPHFGPDHDHAGCGGCAVQHIAHGTYEDWKRELVAAPLRARGIETDGVLAQLITAHPGERRRVVFAARREGNSAILGFNRAGSHDIVAIRECPIATPRIVSALDLLRGLAAQAAVKPKAFQMAVLDSQSGFDIAFTAPFQLSENDRLRLVASARKAASVARITHNDEVLIEKHPPQLPFGDVIVTPPPGGFTQASANAEAKMAEIVMAHMTKAKRVADLYAGCGTFSARLAKSHIVHAVEGYAPALKALDNAMRKVQGFKPVSIETRDLTRRPLMAMELKNFQGLVFDPPRAGSEAQAVQIAKSSVKYLAAVSCNPATLARDLRILIDGGYRLTSVTPIDQFLWTRHVEAVALLEK